MAGGIPINLGDLPIDSEPLDESVVYTGEFKKAAINPKTDKNGNVFCGVQLQVVEGDYEGQTVMGNYLPLPQAITEDMSKAERIRAQNASVAFARFCRAFKISGEMPAVTPGDINAYKAWQEWISQFYGNTGKFTVRNQEFPEGSGRMRSGLSDFIV